jgi:hypothetical protein
MKNIEFAYFSLPSGGFLFYFSPTRSHHQAKAFRGISTPRRERLQLNKRETILAAADFALRKYLRIERFGNNVCCGTF